MRRTSLRPATLLAFGALCTFALGGCSAFENIGGGKKVSPDEFKIVSHSPLTMPPNAELRPPRPGEPRPQEVTPADPAKEALSPAPAGRTPARATAAGAPPAPGPRGARARAAGPPPPPGRPGSREAWAKPAGKTPGGGGLFPAI